MASARLQQVWVAWPFKPLVTHGHSSPLGSLRSVCSFSSYMLLSSATSNVLRCPLRLWPRPSQLHAHQELQEENYTLLYVSWPQWLSRTSAQVPLSPSPLLPTCLQTQHHMEGSKLCPLSMQPGIYGHIWSSLCVLPNSTLWIPRCGSVPWRLYFLKIFFQGLFFSQNEFRINGIFLSRCNFYCQSVECKASSSYSTFLLWQGLTV